MEFLKSKLEMKGQNLEIIEEREEGMKSFDLCGDIEEEIAENEKPINKTVFKGDPV